MTKMLKSTELNHYVKLIVTVIVIWKFSKNMAGRRNSSCGSRV